MGFYSLQHLISAIFKSSVEKLDIRSATEEWVEIRSYPVVSGICVCGQSGLHTKYVFVNKHNGKELHVGSTCREHFYAFSLVA